MSSSSPITTRSYSTPIPTASRTNPISLRIYKALGTNFDDQGSREALEIASSFYAPASSELKGKTKADHHHLPGDDDDGHLGGSIWKRSLRGSSTTGGDGSASVARKYLRRDVESKLAEGSQKFLEAFSEVDKKLNVLREHMLDMQVRCDQVQAELDQANSGTKYLLERADGLRNQRASAQHRQTLITLFLQRFTLSLNESSALTSREIEVGPSVFLALDRVQTIRGDCRALLGGEEGKEQAGLDIMASTAEAMDSGYRKIYRWVIFEFRQFGKDGQLEVSGIMREAIKRLRDRPALLRDAINTLTTTRQSATLQSFLDALTRGGPNGLPRPIELHAHDPTRYVGDMLAWVHQTTASEHEFILGLFGLNSRRMVGQARDVVDLIHDDDDGGVDDTIESGGDGKDGRDGKERKEGLAKESMETEDGEDEKEKPIAVGTMVRETLDKNLDGLGRPLKLRIQQTIKSQEGIIMTFKIANLLQFYLVTMRKTIGNKAMLCKTLQQIYEESYNAFLETLDAHGRSLLRFLHPPDATLSPPLALRDTCQILREIMTVYESSLVDPADRTDNVSNLLNKAVDPAVEMCQRMAELRKSSAWERDIFLINCLSYLQHVLEAFPFTAEKMESLEKEIQSHLESMTFEHHGNLLEQCGLAPIMKTIRTRPADTPLSRLTSTSPKALTTSLSTFSNFLTSLDVLSSPRLALLTSTYLAETIHRTALAKISAAYAEVCERVMDRKEGYEFAETLLRRGREEVAVALGVGEGDIAPVTPWVDSEGRFRGPEEEDDDDEDEVGEGTKVVVERAGVEEPSEGGGANEVDRVNNTEENGQDLVDKSKDTEEA